MRPMRLALAASELTPFAKTGGLADVLLGLGRWLGKPANDDGGAVGHDLSLARMGMHGLKRLSMALGHGWVGLGMALL